MIEFLRKKLSLMTLLIGALLILLGVLATLQYRWLAGVSAGEKDLLQNNLNLKARGFCNDFDREITRAYSAFKVDSETFGTADRNSSYAGHYDQWLSTSAHPGIVKDIFIVDAHVSSSNGEITPQLNLLRFDKTRKVFEPAEWTADLEPLRQRFARQQASNLTVTDSANKDAFNSLTGTVVEDLPALVSIAASVKELDSGTKNSRREFDWERPAGYGVVTLDLDYLKNTFFPALAQKYFAPENSLGYDFVVASRRDSGRIIYQSETGARLSENADAGENFFSIGFDAIKTFSSTSVYSNGRQSSPQSQPPPQSPPDQKQPGFTLVIPALENAKDTDSPSRVMIVNDSAKWQLKASPRSGSLEEIVTNTRRLNIAVSFGILLLLGTSVILIALLSRRSQKLARRQIEFVAGVSHEFRTPLAVIHSLSENLAAGRIKDENQVKRYGETIHRDVRRLTEMIEQILEFAGAERGRHFYDQSPLDIAELIENLLAEHASLVQSGWHIETSIAENLPPVLADSAALSRAVRNLIDNAVKYGGGNRYLKIEAFRPASRQNPEIEIAVEDHGPGIAPADLPHIFEPFYRSPQIVEAQIHGSGLGLNLVKKIIEAHGGKVIVKSIPGRGSRFIIRLPAAAVVEATSQNRLR